MATDTLMLSLADSSTTEGNRFASSLSEALRDIDPSIVVDSPGTGFLPLCVAEG